ncbi:ABC transporter substrate-binding protein [Bradyrhizobium sp. UFLA05-153]
MIYFKISELLSTAVVSALIILGMHSTVRGTEPSLPKIEVGSVGSFLNADLDRAGSLMVAAAYFRKINDDGGIGGRDVDLVSYDDEGSLKRTLDLTRKLVEVDKVTLLFRMNKEANNAIGPYVRFKKVPQVFDVDPDEDSESLKTPPEVQGKFFGEYMLKEMPGAKIAIIHEESRSAHQFLAGFYGGLGEKNARSMITNIDGDPKFLGNRVSRVAGTMQTF